jgi:hypothetical protein
VNFICIRLELNAFFWSFIGVWKRWSNYIFNMKRYRSSLKMYFAQRFHTPMKLQKNAFNIFLMLCYILDVYLLFLFVCTESLTLVSDPASRKFIRWLLFQTFIIYMYIYTSNFEIQWDRYIVWLPLASRRLYNILYFLWLYNEFFIILYNILKIAELDCCQIIYLSQWISKLLRILG